MHKYIISTKYIIIFVLISLLFNSCYIFKYAKAINEEAYNLRLKNRKFINNLAFFGTVVNKFSVEGDIKYKLQIKNLIYTSLSDTNHFSSNYSYYSYRNNILEIAVTKDLYNEVQIGDVINKIDNSDTVIVHNKHILFYDW